MPTDATTLAAQTSAISTISSTSLASSSETSFASNTGATFASTSTSSSSASSSSSNAGAIAGGVVGGVLGLAVIAGGFLLYCKKRQVPSPDAEEPEPQYSGGVRYLEETPTIDTKEVSGNLGRNLG